MLRFLASYNASNFHGDQASVLPHICLALFSAFNAAMYVCCAVLVFWECLDENFNVSSPVVPTFINSIQLILTYLALVWNNRKKTAAIEQLARIIQERKSDTRGKSTSYDSQNESLFP